MNQQPILLKKITISDSLLQRQKTESGLCFYGGDVRIMNIKGKPMFNIHRCCDNGLKPCFTAVMDIEGKTLWHTGNGGYQPVRPGPLACFDINGDGIDEIVCFYIDRNKPMSDKYMTNVNLQIRNGETGEVMTEKHPDRFDEISGEGPNWVHQRILAADLSGKGTPTEFIVKLGTSVFAFNSDLQMLWEYKMNWTEYGCVPAYIPTVGDIDDDGQDEILGGYYLLNSDGTVMWEKMLGKHMDSVKIDMWNNKKRAMCSGYGHVLSEKGDVILSLGEKIVPHGQELRCARFLPNSDKKQLVIRNQGHTNNIILVNVSGKVFKNLKLNSFPNNTGMEDIYFNGYDNYALLYNGGLLWDLYDESSKEFPNLPKPKGPSKMGWYHCIAADLYNRGREDIILYNPWEKDIYIYTSKMPTNPKNFMYQPGFKQYNVRLMD